MKIIWTLSIVVVKFECCRRKKTLKTHFFLNSLCWLLSTSDFNNSLSEQNMAQLWTPTLSFPNARQAEGTVVDSGTLSHVQRAGRRLPDDFAMAIEAQRYYGKDSPIIMEREYFVTFSCYFKLDMYPFDTQVVLLKPHYIRVKLSFFNSLKFLSKSK